MTSIELERRFLVEQLPAGLAGDEGWRIIDRYLDGTRLRLRRMEALGCDESVFKLGQKQATAPPDFSRATITNIYLSQHEYEVLAGLPARELRSAATTAPVAS